MLARDKHSSLLQTFVNYDRKKYYNIGPRSHVTLDPDRDLEYWDFRLVSGNLCQGIITKAGSTVVPLTSCLTGLDQSVLQIKTKIVSCHRADSKLIKQEVDGTVILPPLVFPALV
jgi:hypothetical protein